MLQNIQNGITTGGDAYVPNQLPDYANSYLQYMMQVRKERKEALDKNYDIVKGMDLSKVDPLDREAVQRDYESWRNMALTPPQSNQRGVYNNWRSQVLQGETDLKNRIGDITNERKKISDFVANNKDRLDYDGINQANKLLSTSMVDNGGNVITHDLNSLALKPESVYNTDDDINKIIGQNTVKNNQLSKVHRHSDGKTVAVNADLLNTNKVLSQVQDQYNTNPVFKHATDVRFSQYQKLNPSDTTTTVNDFLNHQAQAHFPAATTRDLQFIKNGVVPGDGIQATNYNTVDPNNYEQHININTAATAAEKLAARQRMYQNTMGAAAQGLHTLNPGDLTNGSQMLSDAFRGKPYGDQGNISAVSLEKGADGKGYVNIITKDPQYGLPKQTRIPADDPTLFRTLHSTYNQQYHGQPQNMMGEDDYNQALANKASIEGHPVAAQPAQQVAPIPGVNGEPIGGDDLTPSAPVTGQIPFGAPTPSGPMGFGAKIQKGLDGLKNFVIGDNAKQ